ncbi:energy-coupling factor transporter ATPase [Pediococcus claussenii]|uniref:Energy-coupling factor transporter ATP-binding protein EcfA2 n=1 Tax=Pediococcus claussenii (strain ATCC BAA-344 / DSM 14800 / JCM 18046 / KCTC 3811 / LMG 21948 / P06) TaxID=701521 RepID=G8PE25_PEDCP|nr:energy-coupling factor transporter ATPase [Pediococcus claussenii]AEV95510.1 energy-coupling factor transporter ATP-binding protein EcfA2 [Pediococcus claussenii ATCC BAA-344]ANZ69033.1 energy-coupling factor transporter ATPase [Pediococcus claussenii]ANZ70849.1 energy-coupling factor transporter ATPase [Pediococcus claussenii]KRN20255.1 ecfA2 protein [Pediococcus claussenii]
MAIDFREVNFSYQAGTPFELQTLFDVTAKIADGSYTAVIGQTGSGKSTLTHQINGLLKPTSGSLVVNNLTIKPTTKNKDLNEVRKSVGMVFQFPENQLFAESVLKDVAFGPMNFGKSNDVAVELAKEALKEVGMDEGLWEKSPFELSGGQMRRVAIAGVLAINPNIIILDEPTAGLDPSGRTEMNKLFFSLQENKKRTIVLVTHQMDDVAAFADNVIVMNNGRVAKTGTPREIFSDYEWLEKNHLDLPRATRMAIQLQKKGVNFDLLPLTIDELTEKLVRMIPGGASNE